MIAGGKTQFLTKAQGKPKNIEKALTKTIRDFIGDNARTPPISLEQLYHPKEKKVRGDFIVFKITLLQPAAAGGGGR